MDDELYKANILDHYRNPRHHGVIDSYTIKEEGKNPSCGDFQTLYLNLKGEVLTQGSFTGEGCAISQAASSMLLEKVIGGSTKEIFTMTDKDMRALLGVPIGESREKCMMLGLDTLKSAISHHA
jgi:nitrogen fixation NifU-like protein